MYKKILTIFALAASLLACNKVENEVVAPENGAKTLTITAPIRPPPPPPPLSGILTPAFHIQRRRTAATRQDSMKMMWFGHTSLRLTIR